MRVLLIDDDKDLCFLVKTFFTEKGYQMDTWHEAKAGIAHAREYHPRLILLDIMLPDLSGTDAVELIRDDPKLKDVPVVFLTGLVGGEENNIQDEGLNIHGNTYPTVGKPFDLEDLLGVVRKYT